MPRVCLLLSTGVAATALLSGVAVAHTLSATQARHAANAYAAKLQSQLEGGYRHSVRSCARKTFFFFSSLCKFPTAPNHLVS